MAIFFITLFFGRRSPTNSQCVLFVSLAGYPPFYDPTGNDLNLCYLIRTAHYNFKRPVWQGISDQAKDLISKLLVTDPKERYDATQTLEHPWFQVM